MEWKTKSIKELCRIEKGAIGITKAQPGPYPLVTLAEERKEHSEYQFDTEAVIIPLVSSTGHGHASMKRIHYQEGEFALGTILCAVIPKDKNELHPLFLYHYLDVFKERILVPLMKGMANVTLSIKSIGEVEIPLPPIGDQLLWVEKFKKVKEKEGHLLEELTYQQTLLKQLRQAILQEAVQGKLTKQWRKENPDLEPASVLLEKIKAEKERLVKEKKVKRGKKQAPDENQQFDIMIPNSWVLVDLDDITQYITDGTHQTPTYVEKGRIFLSAQNVKPFRFIPKDHKYVSDADYKKYILNRTAEFGDLLVARVGAGIGETAVIDQEIEFAFYVSLSLIKTFKQYTSPKYLAIVFNSPYGIKYAKGNISSQGGSAGNFNLGRIRSFLIPLPSLKEQDIIVQRIEALLAKVSQLEEEVQQNQQYAEQLLQSVLREVMEPGKKLENSTLTK